MSSTTLSTLGAIGTRYLVSQHYRLATPVAFSFNLLDIFICKIAGAVFQKKQDNPLGNFIVARCISILTAAVLTHMLIGPILPIAAVALSVFSAAVGILIFIGTGGTSRWSLEDQSGLMLI